MPGLIECYEGIIPQSKVTSNYTGCFVAAHTHVLWCLYAMWPTPRLPLLGLQQLQLVGRSASAPSSMTHLHCNMLLASGMSALWLWLCSNCLFRHTHTD